MTLPFQATSPSQSHPHLSIERNHVMSTLKRSLCSLLFASLLLGATVPGSVSAASAHRPISLLTMQEGRTIRVIGGHFTPGATVTIALLNIHSWHVVSTGTARSEAARYTCPLGVNPVCGRPDPNAGRLYYQTTLHQRISSSALIVLYRSGNQVGVAHVQ
jgi:hypothetical protein